jgi:hypothetical protein
VNGHVFVCGVVGQESERSCIYVCSGGTEK